MVGAEKYFENLDDPADTGDVLIAQARKCGRCGAEFWSEPIHQLQFASLFCDWCEAEMTPGKATR